MALELIETIEVPAGGAASLFFENIPQDGKDLVVLYSYRDEYAGSFGYASLRLNNDSGTNYDLQYIQANASTVFAGQDTSTSFRLLYSEGGAQTAGIFGSIEYRIKNYTSATDKIVSVQLASEDAAANTYFGFAGGRYNTTSAITSVKLLNGQNFTDSAQYSSASLYKLS